MHRDIKIVLFCSFLLFLSSPALTTADEDLQKEMKEISLQLRCPVCRGIPIAESPSELAKDMMRLIEQKLKEGNSREEIFQFFEARYGEWILLEPKPKGLNLLLWFSPILFLLGGGFILWRAIRKWSGRSTSGED